MGAFKTLLASDIIVTPVTYNKSFTFQGNAALTASDVGIDRYLGANITSSIFDPSTDPVTGQLTGSYTVYQRDVFNSTKQLYYTNFLISSSGDPAVVTQDINGILLNLRNGVTASTLNQPNFENYLQNTLTQSRSLPTISNNYNEEYSLLTDYPIIGVITIPNKLYGNYINPGTFNINYTDYNNNSVNIYDNKEGELYINSNKVGDIIYPHGLIIITNNTVTSVSIGGFYAFILNDIFNRQTNLTVSFQSSYTIYETQIKCNIKSSEFTTTLNPSLISGSQGQVYNYATGSFFAPYITTIGLYNENQDLLMVAKLAQPLQSSPTTDTNILINIDR
jgi:hypothetical protein